MSGLPVFVEPIPGGFRASAAGPADLVAEGATADGAVEALQAKVDAKLNAGAKIVGLRLNEDARRDGANYPGMVPGIRVSDEEFNAILDRMASNPLSEQFHQDVRDARAAADAAGSDHPL